METFAKMMNHIRLPIELQIMVTNYLGPEDYLSYRNAFSSDVVGPYLGRRVNAYQYFYMLFEVNELPDHFMYGPSADAVEIRWEVLILLFDTGHVYLSEYWSEPKYDFQEGDSLGLIVGCVAASIGRLDVVDWLLDNDWYGVDTDLSRILIYCFKDEIETNDRIVRWLLADQRVNPTLDRQAALLLAATNNRLTGLGLLLQDGRVDPTFDDHACLMAASKYGHSECVALLLSDSRVNPRASDNRALRLAIEYGHTACIALLGG